MNALDFAALLATCAPQVDPDTVRALVSVESAYNANAIGVVAGSLARQPRDRSEALATAKQLDREGRNFSVGLGQINVGNFRRLGLTLETAFEPCSNLSAMQRVLVECFERAGKPEKPAQRALREALSCYYSGNFSTGFAHGYVRRVARAVPPPASRPATSPPEAKESP